MQDLINLARPYGAWYLVANVSAIISLLTWIYLFTLRGGFWQAHLPSPSPLPPTWPSVVAIVPARNEADVIARSLSALLTQNYPGMFHVLLVDDHSSDDTARVATSVANNLGLSSRLTVLAARDLPTGWSGKVWAQSEGQANAKMQFPNAEYLLLTDADIEHAPTAVQRLVARAVSEQRVLTSLMVRLSCATLVEHMLIPAFVFFFSKLYPFSQVNNPLSKTAAAAGGCMLVRTDALERIGGMTSIKDALIDDCALAAKLKPQGPIRLDLADDSYSLRRCDDWSSIWHMIARTAFTQLRYSPWLLLGTVLGMTLAYLVPPALALFGDNWTRWYALSAWLLMTVMYCPMLRYYRLPLYWAPLLPLTALFYLAATLDSARQYWRGRGGQWKGRAQAQPPH